MKRTSRFTRLAVGWAVLAQASIAGAAAIGGEPSPMLRMSSKLSLVAPSTLRAAPQAASSQASAEAAVAPLPAPLAGGTSSRDYRIGPEDLLEMQVFGVEELTRTVRVNSRGQISLPFIGMVDVGGLTAQQSEALIAAKLRENYMHDPQVSLFIKEYTSQRVTIEGAVHRPGIYPLRGPTSLLQSLALAGGQANLSDMTEVMLFRPDAAGNRQTLVFDVDSIRAGEVSDPLVVSDDLIVVKRSKARAILKDSIFRDVLDTINPFRWSTPLQ